MTAPLDVDALIDDPGTRVVVCCGSGGVGKTTTSAARAIRAAGGKAGLALKPGTPAGPWVEALDEFDQVLVMTVEPGFGGQSFMPRMMDKVAEVRRAIGDRDVWLQVDGGIALDTIEQAAEAGADTFVAGSAVYGATDVEHAIADLRAAAARHAH